MSCPTAASRSHSSGHAAPQSRGGLARGKSRHLPWRSGLVLCATFAVALLAGCDGSSGGEGAPGTSVGGAAKLLKVEYGRLVDVYAYRRVNPGVADRRAVYNRVPVLVERDVVVSATIETQPLFDALGEERQDADFRFRPFDVTVGHEELVILWDDTAPTEKGRFQAALQEATAFLNEVPASYRGQNTVNRPIPVVPRNAAIKLTFDRQLSIDTAFLQANPSAVQFLEFRADPKTAQPGAAFRPLSTRLVAKGTAIVADTTLIGGETLGGQSSNGLPASQDNVTANLRIAMPTSGIVSRNFRVEADAVPELNGIDARGDTAVIRDFRSGNQADGRVGVLVDNERPMLVADVSMGIIEIDRQNRVLTLNKRYSQLPVRGRVPFVDGGLVASTGFPGGPSKVPTDEPLRSGDLLSQDVPVPGTNQRYRIRTEILQNLAVGTVLGDTALPTLGLDAAGTDNGSASIVRVRVASLDFTDPAGNQVTFVKSDLPLGADCKLRCFYYENVPYNASFGNAVVSDTTRRSEFMVVDPAPPLLDANRQPIPRGTLIKASASVALRFSEPMDLDSVQPLDNFFLSNSYFTDENVAALIKEPKPSSLSILAARLIDQERDGTLLRLTQPLGHFHEKTKAERYWLHLILGERGAFDLSRNTVDVFDRRVTATNTNWSASYTLDPSDDNNHVGSRIYRFADADEDGTKPGSVDIFGQFALRDGRLFAAETSRSTSYADGQTLGSILRYDKGHCLDTISQPPPANPNLTPAAPLGPLYLTPNMTATNLNPPLVFQPPPGPRTFGGIVEPHQPRGGRVQMTYREDDFGLSYTDPTQFVLDVEQMHWASWRNDPVLFDVFDRYSISMGHSDRRPDILFYLAPPTAPGQPPTCALDCDSLLSGLGDTFANNPLRGTTMTEVVKDKIYTINPNESFIGATGTLYMPYPKFERTFTWRDSRLVSIDPVEGKVTGLGGARQPDGLPPSRDRTAHVSSPWVPDRLPAGFSGTMYVLDEGDFLGWRALDHDPIALPLLMDFKVYPDNIANGIAAGANLFHIALVGPNWPGTVLGCGYYNSLAIQPPHPCRGYDWPKFRVHNVGGFDPQNNVEVKVDPENTFVASQIWIKDVGLGDPIQGLYKTRSFGDSHTHWAKADFVRKVSTMTFGFFDTLQPNRHALQGAINTTWPGLGNAAGVPDLTTIGPAVFVKDFTSIVDPPPTAQPAGTKVKLEYRFAQTFENSNSIYDRKPAETTDRGNLLNPHYACEAYRYSVPNSNKDPLNISGGGNLPRVAATGLTVYVEEEKIDTIRNVATGLLPRYMNVRVVMENNTQVVPALSPSLRSIAVVYRVAVPN